MIESARSISGAVAQLKAKIQATTNVKGYENLK